MQGKDNLRLPLVVMGCLSVFGGFTSLRLPETLHHKLPQTLEEGEEFGKDWSIHDCWRCMPIEYDRVPHSRRITSLTPCCILLFQADGIDAELIREHRSAEGARHRNVAPRSRRAERGHRAHTAGDRAGAPTIDASIGAPIQHRRHTKDARGCNAIDLLVLIGLGLGLCLCLSRLASGFGTREPASADGRRRQPVNV